MMVERESPSRIRDHLGRQARFNPANSLKALTGQITREYEDRFLVELIQNAYDAQPRGVTDGRVVLLLDETDPTTSTLYIANTGDQFTAQNFDAITNVAQSSKPVGEGIGNKGVGFRSVLQVCPSPEIYSIDPQGDPAATESFDGFCFGFASDDEIRRFVDDDEDDFEEITRDFSRYLLPVVAEPTDPNLSKLRAAGMVTVIKLPLTAPDAAAKVLSQLDNLANADAPVALFLERLQSILMTRLQRDGTSTRWTIERQARTVEKTTNGAILSEVRTAGQRLLTSTRVLRATEIQAVVTKAVAAGELDPAWSSWSSDVEVSLATSLELNEDEAPWPSTYTYLPMRAASPLRAHLHAPFHTRLARLDLNESSRFNRFLLGVAADLAVETVQHLVSNSPSNLNPADRRLAAIDLMDWDDYHQDLLESAWDEIGEDVRAVPFVPTSGPDGPGWKDLTAARAWRLTSTELIGHEQISAKVDLVDASIGSGRQEQLDSICWRLSGRGIDPTDEELATWIELVAERLSERSPATWARFLGEVADLFAVRDPKTLQGRRILIDGSGKVRRAGPWSGAASKASDPTVFIPLKSSAESVLDGEDDVGDIPKNLSRAVAFLHSDVAVRQRVDGRVQQTPVGDMLERGRLVERYELTTVLQHLRRLLDGKVNDNTRRQALAWVFAQERASRAPIANLTSYGLRVPARDGWIPASEAVFSAAWNTERGKSLEELLDAAGDHSATLQTVRAHTLLDPDAWPFKLRHQEAFRDFLTRCGVRDGLMPLPLRTPTPVRMNGNNFDAATIAGRHGLENPQSWIEHVETSAFSDLAGPFTTYTGQSDLWVVPGQDGFADLSDKGRERLAHAVISSMADWPGDVWTYSFQRRNPRHAKKPDPQRWPSPVATFVQRAEWFPMSDAGTRGFVYFVRAASGWSFDESGDESAPQFARLAPKRHRQQLTSSPKVTARLTESGLSVWNVPGSALSRLTELAALIDSGMVAAAENAALRKAIARAWSELSLPDGERLPDGTRFIVSRGSSLETACPSPEAPCDVFVADSGPGLATQILKAAKASVLVADGRSAGKILTMLAALPGARARPTSSAQARVYVDGIEVVPSEHPGEPFVDRFEPWVVQTLLTIIEIGSSHFTLVNEKRLREWEGVLRRMRLVSGASISLSLDGEVVPTSGRFAATVHLADPLDPTLIVAENSALLPSWAALANLADDISELLRVSASAAAIRAASLGLDARVSAWREPTAEELADVLRCDSNDVIEIRRGRRSSVDQRRDLILPFVAVGAGYEAAALLAAEAFDDLAGLSDGVCESVGGTAGRTLLDKAADADTVADLHRALGTDVAELNSALRMLGFAPLRFDEVHVELLALYVSEHRDPILAQLRGRFVDRFDRCDELAAYVDARNLRGITPDPEWAELYERVPATMMAARVDTWIADYAGDPAELESEPIDQLRERNEAAVKTFLPRARKLVSAWSSKRGVTPPGAWQTLTDVQDALRRAGCLDFRPLDDGQVMRWLGAIHLLPTTPVMPATPDLSELGLEPNDLIDASRGPNGIINPTPRPGSLLSVGEKQFDLASQLDEMVAAVITATPDAFFVNPKLSTLPAPKPSATRTIGTADTSKPRSYKGSKLSQEQTDAIGLLGEELAYEWLLRSYATETTPDSWVSVNRVRRLGGHDGHDGLGYDFKIDRRKGALFFEVKATKTDEPEFEMGRSEVNFARRARKGTYRIVFISSILTPGERQLRVLPNPFEPGREAGYIELGSGIRLRFSDAS